MLCGLAGSLKHYTEQLQWAINYDGRPEMLQGLREIGSLIFWMSLLDTAMVRLNYFSEFIAVDYLSLLLAWA